MKCNIGKTDRTVRMAAGVVIILTGLAMQEWWTIFGVVLLTTGLLRWCPVYIPLKINTLDK